ncbi:MAG: T9SS type A sorting domain-containing protein [Bacteroidetes bacterium]|nr:T9SS type A sorting domain-containing protein [Bacteroidota bacterium]
MKKLLLFFSIILLVNYSMALAQEIEWQNTIGGNNDDVLFSVKQTSDGGFILGGYSGSNISGDKTENSFIGSFDYWIVKTDESGNIQWQNTIGGNGDDQLYSIEQTSDGGYILGGYSDSNISGDKTENKKGLHDYWIVKTDSLGNIQWQNTIGGYDYDYLYSIKQTSDNGYILGGYSQSDSSADKTENNIGGWDYWIIKTDSVGNIQWQNTIGGSDNDWLKSIIQTSDGDYLLGGVSVSDISGDKTENCLGGWDYWIVLVDAAGNIKWQQTIGGSASDILNSIQQTGDGGYILGGNSDSNISGDKTESGFGNYDYWIVKVDSLFNIQWQNTIGGSDQDQLNSIIQSANGSYLFGGYSLSNISGDKTESNFGAYDYWVVKTDTSGNNILWQNSLGGNENDQLFSITQSVTGDYMLGGFSYSQISGDKSENCLGGPDYWFVKLTERYNLIKGNVFADLNTNSVHDFGEPLLSNRKITEQSTGRFSFSQQNGEYVILVKDSGNFDVNPVSINNYFANPVSHNAYFSGIQQTDSLNDFAFQPQGTLNDLCVSITPLGPFRSGFTASYMISYENVGTTTISPTVIFFPDNKVTYASSSVTPSTITPDSITWSPGQLAPFQTGNIIVTVIVDTGLVNGVLINSSVRIDPVSGDANPTCNYGAWEVFVTGSYDPNDILVNEDTLTTTQLATEPFLEYIIRYQNTGNDTAFTVKILNPIDTLKLNLSSFEFLNASHNVELKWLPWERNMEFKFNNILLPDSNINEPLSHGYVRYRIQPKTSLVAGDSVTNNAAIYFDFNAPILTNTAITKIVLTTGLQPFSDKYDYAIYPNPTTGTTFIEVSAIQAAQAEVTLLTMQGKLISFENHQLKVGHNKLDLNTSGLSSGIYLVRLVIDGNSVVKKLVKM